MSLVNVSLKLWSLNMAYTVIFLLKMWVTFAFAKATHFFFSKNTYGLSSVLTRTVNILTTNDLVKLTMRWATGPRFGKIFWISLRKHAYLKYKENFTSKNWNFSDKNSYMFHISAQNIDCGYSLEPPRRGSNEYHNLCFWAEIRKIMYTPVNPSFTT